VRTLCCRFRDPSQAIIPTGTQNQISKHICAGIENSGHSSLPADTACERTRRRLPDHLHVRPSDPRTIIPALADAAHVSPQTTAGILMNGSIISTGLPLDAPAFRGEGGRAPHLCGQTDFDALAVGWTRRRSRPSGRPPGGAATRPVGAEQVGRRWRQGHGSLR